MCRCMTWFLRVPGAAKEVAARLGGVSPLGEYQAPLRHLLALTAIRPIARTFVKLPAWLPRVPNGRAFQVSRAAPLSVSPGLPVAPGHDRAWQLRANRVQQNSTQRIIPPGGACVVHSTQMSSVWTSVLMQALWGMQNSKGIRDATRT